MGAVNGPARNIGEEKVKYHHDIESYKEVQRHDNDHVRFFLCWGDESEYGLSGNI